MVVQKKEQHQGYNSDMETTPLPPPVWISSSIDLAQVCHTIQHEPRIAVDTESNSLFAYKEKVCLIQISTPEMDYVIDPFICNDLSPLETLFSNLHQEKIFHASEYDLICLKRDYGFSFVNIFDTMIAARILGIEAVGLGSLLKDFFGISLEKKYQRANWGIRPLPPEMLDYARLDTHYLFKLRDLLENQLAINNLLDLAHEDFISACNAQAQTNENHHSECWRVAGANHMDARQATILNELCLYRDDQARKADLPLFKVISNELLFEISKHKPISLDDLSTVPHCPEKIIRRHGENLVKAVARGEQAPLISRQKPHRPDDAYIARIDLLREWRKQTAKQLKVESDIVLPKDLLERIAAMNPTSKPELRTVMKESLVRYRKFGNLILKTLKSQENV